MALKMKERVPDGTKLYTLAGEEVVVRGLISEEGGQGDVYRVEWRGKEYALKWYNRNAADVTGSDQYAVISRLVHETCPEPSLFIWPLGIVTESGSEEDQALFGYVMELIPDGYFVMKHFLRPNGDSEQKRFVTFHAMIWAGMHIVTAVRALHTAGLSYKDLNPGNIAIHPATGKIRMVDCDNISLDSAPCTVNGMRGYMAPEIVRSDFRRTPNIQTDLFSEAVILFQLFYMDHPMEGKLWERFPLITDAVEDELYSRHPVYNMNPQDERNRPSRYFAPNVQRRMKMLPSVLKQGFEKTFVNGIDHVMGRTLENEWLKILSAARDQLVFLSPDCTTDCVVHFDRKKTIPAGCLRMTVSRRMNHEIALYPMQSIFQDVVSGDGGDYSVRIGRVSVSKGSLVLQNCSGKVWDVFDPAAGKVTQAADGVWLRVMPGTKIQFDRENKIVGKVDDPHA